MRFWIATALILSILLLMLCSAFLYNHTTKEQKEYNNIMEEKFIPETIQMNFLNATDESVITSIAQNVANAHEYKLGKYDCTEFSKELVKQLNANGYNSYCVAGYMFDPETDYRKYLHTWVEVNVSGKIIPVEATSGQIIAEQDYENYHKIRRKVCW